MVLRVQGGPSLLVAPEAPVEMRCDATVSLGTFRSSGRSSDQPLKVSVSIKKADTGGTFWPHVDWSPVSLSQGEDSLEEAAACFSGICNENPPASLTWTILCEEVKSCQSSIKKKRKKEITTLDKNAKI